MNTLDFKPLRDNIVTLIEQKRGVCKKFMDDLLLGSYHNYEFEISKDDAKTLFQEMKRMTKINRWQGHYGHNNQGWFFQIQGYSQPILRKVGEKYLLTINSWRNA